MPLKTHRELTFEVTLYVHATSYERQVEHRECGLAGPSPEYRSSIQLNDISIPHKRERTFHYEQRVRNSTNRVCVSHTFSPFTEIASLSDTRGSTLYRGRVGSAKIFPEAILL